MYYLPNPVSNKISKLEDSLQQSVEFSRTNLIQNLDSIESNLESEIDNLSKEMIEVDKNLLKYENKESEVKFSAAGSEAAIAEDYELPSEAESLSNINRPDLQNLALLLNSKDVRRRPSPSKSKGNPKILLPRRSS